MDVSFEIGVRKFQVRKINALKQFHVVRRVAPLLADLIPAMKGFAKEDDSKLTEEQKFDRMAKVVAPIMTGLSKLSDQDSEFVLFSLLEASEMQQSSGNWAQIAKNGNLMIQDLELPTLLQIAGRAFGHNLSGFFAVLPSLK